MKITNNIKYFLKDAKLYNWIIFSLVFNTLYVLAIYLHGRGSLVKNGIDVSLMNSTLNQSDPTGILIDNIVGLNGMIFLIYLIIFTNYIAGITKKHNSVNSIYLYRMSRKKFIIGRCLSYFSLGFLITFLVYGLNMFTMEFVVPNHGTIFDLFSEYTFWTNYRNLILNETLMHSPYLFEVVYVVLISIFFGLVSIVAYGLSTLLKRKIMTPLLCFAFVFILCSYLDQTYISISIFQMFFQSILDLSNVYPIAFWFTLTLVIGSALNVYNYYKEE